MYSRVSENEVYISDAEQLGLIAFLASEKVGITAQPAPVANDAVTAAGCVQFEHMGPASRIENGKADADVSLLSL